jgi:hypothetical protein
MRTAGATAARCESATASVAAGSRSSEVVLAGGAPDVGGIRTSPNEDRRESVKAAAVAESCLKMTRE